MFSYHFNCTTIILYTLFPTLFSNLLNSKSYVIIQWSEDSYYMPNNKETEGLICNSEDKKQNISKSPFFLGLNKVRLN